MHTLLVYVVKMVLCSGLLFTYYWCFLRNKQFHQYNRFYLLSSVFFSLLVPLVHLSWFTVKEELMPKNTVVQVLYADDLDPVVVSDRGVNGGVIAGEIVLGISAILLLLVAFRVVQVLRLAKKYPSTHWKEIELLDTDIPNAPFSFFRYLFWKDSIDLDSTTGRQVLEHEMTHIRQKHSWDKLFIQAASAVFWVNPFFWLCQRELFMIHEFLADEQAIKNKDVRAFAEMLVASRFDKSLLDPVHPFAYKPVKRRMQMLSVSSRPSYSYLRRLLFLPLLFFVTGLLAISIRKQNWEQPKIALSEWAKSVGINLRVYDTSLFPTGKNRALPEKKLPDSLILIRDNKRRDTIANISSVKLNGLVADLQIGGKHLTSVKREDSVRLSLTVKPQREHPWKGDPLYIVDGTPMEGKENLASLNPNDIASITILKDESATALYGEKGVNGVLLITTKKAHLFQNVKSVNPAPQPAASPKEETSLKEVIVVGYGKRKVAESQKVDQEPHFAGGTEAWRHFLMRNLHTDVPASKGAPDGQYTVILSFVVDKKGKLSHIKAINDPGYGVAKEAVRTMKTSPVWQPASLNGKPVTYKQRQQITFEVTSE